MFITEQEKVKPGIHGKQKLWCYHCGQECKTTTIATGDKYFCCEGCKSVYEILDSNNLCNYYDLNNSTAPGVTQRVPIYEGRFAYLDDEKTKAQLIEFTDGKQTSVSFFIPGIHCTSCIWLLENMHRLHKGFIRSQVNFLKRTVSLTYNEEDLSLRKVVELLTSVGYEPHIDIADLEKKQIKKNGKELWYKVGVAGFCAGNVMMLSFPEYFAGEGNLTTDLQRTFSYLSLGLSLPAVFYSASHIFLSAYNGLKQRVLNIDFPVSLGLAITFIRSVYEILWHVGPGFMDSLCGLIFFLLIGRAFQSKTYQTLSFERDFKSYFPVSVMIKKNGHEKSVPISALKIGDIIVVRNHEVIPADALLLSPNANIDYSFVTGESTINDKLANQTIYAGGRQQGPAIELKIMKEVSASYLTRLWNDETFNKTNEDGGITKLANKAGQYFTVLILLFSFGAAAYWWPNVHKAMDAFIAILIISCPCGLALTSPFALGNAMRIAGKNKLYLKNAQVLEHLSAVDCVVFDKTGTITQSHEARVEILPLTGKSVTDDDFDLIRSVVRHSAHPLSKIINDYLKGYTFYDVSEFKEQPGKGITAQVNGNLVTIGSAAYIGIETDENPGNSAVYVAINGQALCTFNIKNNYRQGWKLLLKHWAKNSNYTLYPAIMKMNEKS
ncbi:MAG: heavy metal translocating P-type ATPase metal-binding domain-containing protein [Sphingobacteriales bacterium JAD_PAG50586_3]|nr:MAG: heavy metal translocating P-type ATPase metal-binding domain-containing protein [Sphingobacteriales bacterium JAD_PAG50586_3]